jgi:hypothetical protein
MADQYVEAWHQSKTRGEEVAMMKERNKVERVESWKRKVAKREEAVTGRELEC